MKIIGLTRPVFPWVIKILTICLSLLIINSCSFSRIQADGLYYDALTDKYVYHYVEKMPEYKNGKVDFSQDFIKLFNTNNFQGSEKQTVLKIQFVIDSQGSLIGQRIYNKNLNELSCIEKSALLVVSELQDWSPGKHHDKNVNVLISVIINIDYQE